jgi:hypothetical protein
MATKKRRVKKRTGNDALNTERPRYLCLQRNCCAWELRPGIRPGVATFRCLNHNRMESESAGSRVSLLALRKDLPVHSFPG